MISLNIQDILGSIRPTDILAIALLISIFRLFNNARSRVRTTKLKGPISDNLFVGVFPKLGGSDDPKVFLDETLKEFGTAFSIPMGFGRRDIVVCDAKGAAHILARDTFGYQQQAFARIFLDNMLGKNGILSTERDDHRRIRRAMTPAFSNSAIRGYIEAFHGNYDKMSSAWDAILDSGASTIEVQGCLENLGLAGFSHEFKALVTSGETPELIHVIESFKLPASGDVLSKAFFFLSPLLPWLLKLPSDNTRLLWRLRFAMKDIADNLLEKTKQELEIDGSGAKVTDKSIIGTLIKVEGASSGSFTMTSDEVLSQNTLFLAGYETTSTAAPYLPPFAQWALVELARHPEIQGKLRDELNETLHSNEASWEQLTSGLPYLEAFTQEILRVHAPVDILLREAHENDVVPLSKTHLVSEIVIAKGESLHIPIGFINMSEDLWGPDVREFNPERWMKDLPPGAQAIQGHHHLMSFSDGPRFCLGRHFALANFKATLSNLIRRYTFELPRGKDTEIVRHIGLIPRPMVVGEEGPRVPLVVQRIE
ncbi:cytochrome P450 [Coprinellus micaceus]|uniref:Cytochrome P450 n=1 Tax=Coprinellus micaceus TaxID=71717 RepID=A0A4Y7SAH9_COPMI|nr:cytochrome P450 [Coprinellus micaceus]